ncbi:hypothetical protein Fluta_2766 [Fluviicola taffensis DSM 16823]|uniref:Uncharacterized protein n=1 Tax=Fluviicola taffensis (strain DSM 16823 / NCIMB 13979 / RW262) TaxID=755732 RepID=F2IGW5_FLUTR|nr:hypothetical protein Fluta_2766 [Fluviicola taffensis DSM 16823]
MFTQNPLIFKDSIDLFFLFKIPVYLSNISTPVSVNPQKGIS